MRFRLTLIRMQFIYDLQKTNFHFFTLGKTTIFTYHPCARCQKRFKGADGPTLFEPNNSWLTEWIVTSKLNIVDDGA